MFEKVQFWLVYCSTGCSCCSGENHFRGPFRSAEEANRRASYLYKNPVLASQYAPKGRYSPEGPYDGELLPDGRVIHESTVYPGFITVREDGDPEFEDTVTSE